MRCTVLNFIELLAIVVVVIIDGFGEEETVAMDWVAGCVPSHNYFWYGKHLRSEPFPETEKI